MYNVIKQNQKLFMAIFGVILMIAFIIPSTLTQMQRRYSNSAGKIGNREVMVTEVQNAGAEFDFLLRLRAREQQQGREIWVPFPLLFIPEYIAAEIKQRPILYYLLQAEARAMGLTPNYAEADSALDNTNVGVLMPDGSTLPVSDVPQANFRKNAQYALANLFLVRDAFSRSIMAVKISEPMLAHEMAARFQQVKVVATDVSAKSFEAQTGNPTDQDLRTLFDKYADVEKGTLPSESNPFGIGYKYPNRVKLQYIAIPRTEVRKAVQASRDAYDWEVEASKYYQNHLN